MPVWFLGTPSPDLVDTLMGRFKGPHVHGLVVSEPNRCPDPGIIDALNGWLEEAMEGFPAAAKDFLAPIPRGLTQVGEMIVVKPPGKFSVLKAVPACVLVRRP